MTSLLWISIDTEHATAFILKWKNKENLQVRQISPYSFFKAAVDVVNIWYLDLQLHIQSVSITTKVVISNSAHGEMYSNRNYVCQ